jgi:hypothetical protein
MSVHTTTTATSTTGARTHYTAAAAAGNPAAPTMLGSPIDTIDTRRRAPPARALGGREREWECRTEACPAFGQPVRADGPPTRDERDRGASARERV